MRLHIWRHAARNLVARFTGHFDNTLSEGMILPRRRTRIITARRGEFVERAAGGHLSRDEGHLTAARREVFDFPRITDTNAPAHLASCRSHICRTVCRPP
jgi:hypothetical protein